MKLGPLNKVMGMIPGMPPWMAQGAGGGPDGGNDRIKIFMYIMDSMTDAELDGKVDITPQRIQRIARGCGQHPEYVNVLLKCHKQFEGVVKKMGKSGLMKGGDQGMAQKMMRNPQVRSVVLFVLLSYHTKFFQKHKFFPSHTLQKDNLSHQDNHF